MVVLKVSILLLAGVIWRCGVLGWMPFVSADPALPHWSFPDVVKALRVDAEPRIEMVTLDGEILVFEAPEGFRLRVWSWDRDAIVYVDAGPDGAPGVAGVDDDGNGVIDDLAELGATGSDDRVLTPGDSGYDEAAAGQSVSIILSRGAMQPVAPNQTVQDPTEVRIDLIDDENRLSSRVLRLAAHTAPHPRPLSPQSRGEGSEEME